MRLSQRLDSACQKSLVERRHLAMKRNASAFAVSHALESPHKVQMPVCSVVFSVADYAQTGLFLLLHKLLDGISSDVFQLFCRNFSFFKLLSRFFQSRRSEETANMVGSLRCCNFGVKNVHYLIRLCCNLLFMKFDANVL